MPPHPQNGPLLGFIGVGAMGGPMARSLLKADHPVLVYDINPARVAECVGAGAQPADTAADVVLRCDTVLTSLRSSEIFVEVAQSELVPNARQGQLFLDMGTTAPPEARRIAEVLAEKGAALVDAPVSGGPQGAERGTLHIFAGGEPEAFDRARPVLDVLGHPDHITYCGPSGIGQVVKGVNQLVMGLVQAAHLEALAFGVRAGVPAETLLRAIQGDDLWRRHFAGPAKEVAEDRTEHLEVKFPELHYFLSEAEAAGFKIPITEALFEFLDPAERSARDSMDRPTPSFWRELLRAGSGGPS